MASDSQLKEIYYKNVNDARLEGITFLQFYHEMCKYTDFACSTWTDWAIASVAALNSLREEKKISQESVC